MNLRITLSIWAISIMSYSYGQKSSNYEIGLKTGDIIKVNSLKRSDDHAYLQIKGKRYKYDQVSYLIDHKRYYIMAEPGPSLYLRRIEGKKVCSYSGERTSTNKPTGQGYSGLFGDPDAAKVGEHTYYYQKNEGEFKRMILENLLMDLNDNEKSMKILLEIDNDKDNDANRNKFFEALEIYNQ
jgi:hypothetical protein